MDKEVMQGSKGLSGSTLKWIAVVTMLIDHIAAVILARTLIANGLYDAIGGGTEAVAEWMQEYAALYGIYGIMRSIGRLAFPIYCFLLVEGFQHTHDVKKYLIRLGCFAIVSEIPFDLALKSQLFAPDYQNVFFTLLLGLTVISLLREIEGKSWKQSVRITLMAIVVAAGCLAAWGLRTDYSYMGVLAIAVLYLFRTRKKAQIVAGVATFVCMGASEMLAALAFIPIGFYNGRRGQRFKYFFYAFYPLHLLLLYGIIRILGLSSIPAV